MALIAAREPAAPEPVRRWRLFERPALVALLGIGLPLGIIGLALGVLPVLRAPMPGLLTAALLAVSCAVLLVPLWRLLRRELSTGPMLAALAWGALVIGIPITQANQLWGGVASAALIGGAPELESAALVAGPVEETFKLLCVLLIGLVWPAAVSGVRRGLLVGLLVGLGFGTAEHLNTVTAFASAAPEEVQLRVVVEGLAVRTLAIGLYLHAGLTGLSGAAVGSAVTRPGGARVVGVVGTLVVVAGLHSLANSGLIDPPFPPWDWGDAPALVGHGLLRSLPFLAVVGILVEGGRPRAADASVPVSGQ